MSRSPTGSRISRKIDSTKTINRIRRFFPLQQQMWQPVPDKRLPNVERQTARLHNKASQFVICYRSQKPIEFSPEMVCIANTLTSWNHKCFIQWNKSQNQDDCRSRCPVVQAQLRLNNNIIVSRFNLSKMTFPRRGITSHLG